MNKKLLTFIWAVVSVISTITLFSIDYSNKLDIKDITVHKSTHPKETRVNDFPYKENYTGEYSVVFSLLMDGETNVNIIPDDEITSLSVDGESVSLDSFSRQELRDYEKGFIIELNRENIDGWSKVKIDLKNGSNPTGLDVRTVSNITYSKSTLVFILLAIFSCCLTRTIPIHKVQYLVVIVSIAASSAYLLKTPSNTRTFDVYEGGGHRDYINYIIDKKELPPPGEGWEYHQPPLYYLTAALVKSSFYVQDNDTWGQVLALWFWVIFLVASMGAVSLTLKGNIIALTLASITICLWPSGIIHSIRIGNDVPLYAFYALSFYFCMKWWLDERKSRKTLIWALVWASCALLTKSNGLAIWAVIGTLIFLYSFFGKDASGNREKVRRFISISVVYSVFLVASLLINLSDNIYDYARGESSDWLLSNVSTTINPGLKVDNGFKNYLLIDFPTYFEYPFISTWEDKYGRQYFWNFLFRSSLSSEFFFDGKNMTLWGKTNGTLLFVYISGLTIMAIYFLGSGTAHRKTVINENAPWVLSIFFLLLLLLAYRIKVPLSCNTDFRYVYPLLAPLIVCGLTVWKNKKQHVLKTLTLSAPAIAILTIPWLFWL